MGYVGFSTGEEAGLNEKLPLVTMLAEVLSAVFPSQNQKSSEDGTCSKMPFFSPRQMRILSMVVNRLTSKEIARVLEISSRTVETHLEHMQARTGAKTTAHLITLVFHTDRISV